MTSPPEGTLGIRSSKEMSSDPSGVWEEVVPSHPLRFEQVRIENTAHCGYGCFFCPREQLTRPRGFMPLTDFSLVLDRLGEHSGRVDLHGFGEPLLDTELAEKITLLKERWPQSMPTIYSTLGVRISLQRLLRLVAAGLRHIEVSFYGTDADSYALAHGAKRFECAKENLEALVRVRDELGSPLKIVVRSFPHHDEIKQPGTSEEAVCALHTWMMSLGVELIRERALHNYGSGRAYNPPGRKTPCSVIWGLRYRILQITWDLDVIPCCFDFNAEVRLGNLRKQTLADIFDSPLYRRFYRAHALGKLEQFSVCRSCERCLES